MKRRKKLFSLIKISVFSFECN